MPNDASLQYRYGLSLYLTGEEEQAIEVLGRAHKLAPDSIDILLRLTLLYKKRQQWGEAIAGARKLIELQPQNPMFQHILRETQQEAAAQPEEMPERKED